MAYNPAVEKILEQEGVEESTIMRIPCLRYKGEFMAMVSEKFGGLVIKVSADRVNELVCSGMGREFNFSKKRFREWVVIPAAQESLYEGYLHEALAYAKK